MKKAAHEIPIGTVIYPNKGFLYIPRRTDEELVEHILSGANVALMHSRRFGKTSMLYHSQVPVEKAGHAVAILTIKNLNLQVENLKSRATESEEELWYRTFLKFIVDPREGWNLSTCVPWRLKDAGITRAQVDEWWEETAQSYPFPPETFIMVLGLIAERVVEEEKSLIIFMDEVNRLNDLEFTGAFFALLRSGIRERNRNVQFVLCGIGSLESLTQDPIVTLNTLAMVEMESLDLSKAIEYGQPVLERYLGPHTEFFLNRVFEYTSGQPLLTMQFCIELKKKSTEQMTPEDLAILVDNLAADLMRGSKASNTRDHLGYIESELRDTERHKKQGADTLGVLLKYEKILAGEAEGVPVGRNLNAIDRCLTDSGIVEWVKRGDDYYLVPATKIYAGYFNRGWVTDAIKAYHQEQSLIPLREAALASLSSVSPGDWLVSLECITSSPLSTDAVFAHMLPVVQAVELIRKDLPGLSYRLIHSHRKEEERSGLQRRADVVLRVWEDLDLTDRPADPEFDRKPVIDLPLLQSQQAMREKVVQELTLTGEAEVFHAQLVRNSYLSLLAERTGYDHGAPGEVLLPLGATGRHRRVSEDEPIARVYVGLKAMPYHPDIDERDLRSAQRRLARRGRQHPGDLLRLQRERALAEERRRGDDPKGAGVDVMDLVETYPLLVLLGNPGTGKTTFLRWMTHRCVSELQDRRGDEGTARARLPIMLRVSEFADFLYSDALSRLPDTRKGPGEKIHAFLTSHFVENFHLSAANASILGDEVRKALSGGRALVVFDGLDELKDGDYRRSVVEEITAFCGNHAPSETHLRKGEGNRFIVTSRIFGYDFYPFEPPFAEFQLLPFDDQQREEFAGRIARSEGEKRGFLKALAANPNARDIAGTPLLLRVMFYVFLTAEELPPTKFKLYESVAKITYSRLGPYFNIPDEQVESVFIALGAIAAYIHEKRPTGVASGTELSEHLHAVMEVHGFLSEDLIKRLLPESPILRERLSKGVFQERGPGLWGFRHLSFQEFFFGYYLAATGKLSGGLTPLHNRHRPRWREPLLFAIGYLDRTGEAGTPISYVLKKAEQGGTVETVIRRDLMFAAAAAAACNAHGLKDDLVKQVATGLLKVLAGKEGARRFYRLQVRARRHFASLYRQHSAAVLEAMRDAIGSGDRELFLTIADLAAGGGEEELNLSELNTELTTSAHLRSAPSLLKNRPPALPEGPSPEEVDTLARLFGHAPLELDAVSAALATPPEISETVHKEYDRIRLAIRKTTLFREIRELAHNLTGSANDTNTDFMWRASRLYMQVKTQRLLNHLLQTPLVRLMRALDEGKSHAHCAEILDVALADQDVSREERRLVVHLSNTSLSETVRSWSDAFLREGRRGDALRRYLAQSTETEGEALGPALRQWAVEMLEQAADADAYFEAGLFARTTEGIDRLVDDWLGDRGAERERWALSVLQDATFRAAYFDSEVRLTDKRRERLLGLLHPDVARVSPEDRTAVALDLLIVLDGGLRAEVLDPCWQLLAAGGDAARDVFIRLRREEHLPWSTGLYASLKRGLANTTLHGQANLPRRAALYLLTRTMFTASRDVIFPLLDALGEAECPEIRFNAVYRMISITNLNNELERWMQEAIDKVIAYARSEMADLPPEHLADLEDGSSIAAGEDRDYRRSLRLIAEELGSDNRAAAFRTLLTLREPIGRLLLTNAEAPRPSANPPESLADRIRRRLGFQARNGTQQALDTEPLVHWAARTLRDAGMSASLLQAGDGEGVPRVELACGALLNAMASGGELGTAASLAFLAADVRRQFVEAVQEVVADCVDDRIRMRVNHYYEFGLPLLLPTDGSSDAIGSLAAFFARHLPNADDERRHGISAGTLGTLSVTAMAHVVHQDAFWIARWLKSVKDGLSLEEQGIGCHQLMAWLDLDSVAVEPLVTAASDPDRQDGFAAVKGLHNSIFKGCAASNSTPARNALITALHHKDRRARVCAAQALGWFDRSKFDRSKADDAIVSALCEAVETFPEDRALARAALISCGRVLADHTRAEAGRAQERILDIMQCAAQRPELHRAALAAAALVSMSRPDSASLPIDDVQKMGWLQEAARAFPSGSDGPASSQLDILNALLDAGTLPGVNDWLNLWYWPGLIEGYILGTNRVSGLTPELRMASINLLLSYIDAHKKRGPQHFTDDLRQPTDEEALPGLTLLTSVFQRLSRRLASEELRGDRDSDQVVSLFAYHARDTESWQVRESCIRVLGALRVFNAEVGSVFFEACNDVESVTNAAIEAVGDFRDVTTESVPLLLEHLRGESDLAASKAAALLGRFAVQRDLSPALETQRQTILRVLEETVSVSEGRLELGSEGTIADTLDNVLFLTMERIESGADADRDPAPRHDMGNVRSELDFDALSADDRTIGSGPPSNYNNGLPPGITNTAGWSDSQIETKLDEVKVNLDWDITTGSARKWWDAFENENQHRVALVLRLAEELQNRKTTITEFFLAYVYSNTDNIQANLSYLDYTRLKKEEERKKRAEAAKERFQSTLPENYPSPPGLPAGITNTKGWTDSQIGTKLTQVKVKLDWDNTTGSARKWWDAFESENQHRVALILRLAEELEVRKATITEFFLAYVYSNTDNIQANLCYLDYTRLKKEEEKRKKEAAARALEESYPVNKEKLKYNEADASAQAWWDETEQRHDSDRGELYKIAARLVEQETDVTECYRLSRLYSLSLDAITERLGALRNRAQFTDLQSVIDWTLEFAAKEYEMADSPPALSPDSQLEVNSLLQSSLRVAFGSVLVSRATNGRPTIAELAANIWRHLSSHNGEEEWDVDFEGRPESSLGLSLDPTRSRLHDYLLEEEDSHEDQDLDLLDDDDFMDDNDDIDDTDDDSDEDGKPDADGPSGAISLSTELTFIRCPSCRSLVPAVSSRCRMCGVSLQTDNTSTR